MYDQIHQMTPHLPKVHRHLADMAVDIFEGSAALAGTLHPVTMAGLVDFLRITNTYYSNLIENHHTHPLDIERAMAQEYDGDPAKRDLQLEARAHVALEAMLDEEVTAGAIRPTAPDFIKSIHKRFYEQLPQRFRTLPDNEGKAPATVVPGAYRDHHVKVGRLVPAAPQAIDAFMAAFDRHYRLDRFSRVETLLSIAAAHHRLMWIHPFSDGNGRVARLFSSTCLKMAGVTGYGVWTINRGLARFRDDYMAALDRADAHRQGDLDGRGYLSQEGLNRFCKFFFTICLDQIAFMGTMLDLHHLLPRIEQYLRWRAEDMIPGVGPLRPEARHLIREAFSFGTFQRGQAARITGLKERTARTLLATMVDEDLLISDTPKGPVRLRFSAHMLPVLFPELGPE